jgi:thiosulfate reductase cytochrome b subunit
LAFLTMGNFINHKIYLIRITIQPARVRITDWINPLAGVLMVTSGWQIYDASPIFPALQLPRAITLGGWLLQKLRDKTAVRRFFKHLLASCPEVPRKIVTNQLRISGGEGRDPRTGQREARLLQS